MFWFKTNAYSCNVATQIDNIFTTEPDNGHATTKLIVNAFTLPSFTAVLKTM